MTSCTERQHGLFFKKNRVPQRRAEGSALIMEKGVGRASRRGHVSGEWDSRVPCLTRLHAVHLDDFLFGFSENVVFFADLLEGR